jgi:hypothetical protein
MIVVDTSVWVAYFRGSEREIVGHLQALLDDDCVALVIPVKVEILGGASAGNLSKLRRVLTALPTFYPTADTWRRIEGWIETAVRKGERFGAADLLVAALAAEGNMNLWSLDRDFERMQKLGLVRLHNPDSKLGLPHRSRPLKMP